MRAGWLRSLIGVHASSIGFMCFWGMISSRVSIVKFRHSYLVQPRCMISERISCVIRESNHRSSSVDRLVHHLRHRFFERSKMVPNLHCHLGLFQFRPLDSSPDERFDNPDNCAQPHGRRDHSRYRSGGGMQDTRTESYGHRRSLPILPVEEQVEMVSDKQSR